MRFLQTGTCGCNMASFSLHDGTSSATTRTLLVSKAVQSLCITVVSFLFKNVIKTIICLITRGWVWGFNSDQTLVRASIFCGKAGDFTLLKWDWMFSKPVLTFALARTDALVRSVSQIRITSTIKHQFWKTEMCQLSKESLPVMLLAGRLLSYLTEYID